MKPEARAEPLQPSQRLVSLSHKTPCGKTTGTASAEGSGSIDAEEQYAATPLMRVAGLEAEHPNME